MCNEYCKIITYALVSNLFQREVRKFLKKFLIVAQATEIVSLLRYTFNVINQNLILISVSYKVYNN